MKQLRAESDYPDAVYKVAEREGGKLTLMNSQCFKLFNIVTFSILLNIASA